MNWSRLARTSALCQFMLAMVTSPHSAAAGEVINPVKPNTRHVDARRCFMSVPPSFCDVCAKLIPNIAFFDTPVLLSFFCPVSCAPDSYAPGFDPDPCAADPDPAALLL